MSCELLIFLTLLRLESINKSSNFPKLQCDIKKKINAQKYIDSLTQKKIWKLSGGQEG